MTKLRFHIWSYSVVADLKSEPLKMTSHLDLMEKYFYKY